MNREFENTEELFFGGGDPNPIDEAIHLNTVKEWEQALGQRAIDDSLPSFDTEVLPTRDLIEDLLKGMHQQERQTLQLRFGFKDGIFRTFKQIAVEMQFSESTAKRRYKSGMEALRINSDATKKKLQDSFAPID